MLKREISRFNVLIASAGAMVGSGWLFSPYISAKIAGSNALISWVIASIFMLFIALPLCELGTMFPVSGGMTNYPSFTHGKKIGFMFAWTSWISYVVMTPIEIQAIMQYVSWVFPELIVNESSSLGLSSIGYVVAITAMVFIVILNLFGIKLVTQCNSFASILKYIMPTIAIVTLFTKSPVTNNIDIDLSDMHAWAQIFSALSVGGIIFAFAGFQNGLMLAGEVKNPQKDIPIAILGSIVIAFLLYFLLQWSFIISVPKEYLHAGWSKLSFVGSHGPLVGLTVLVGLTWVATLLMFDAMISPLGTAIIYTASTSRIVYGMAMNHHLPRWFTTVNSHQIPYLALIVNFFAGAISFLPFPSWQKMVTFLSSCSILTYGIGPICILAMRRIAPDHARPFKLRFHKFFSYMAFYFCNLMLYWCNFDTLWKLDVVLAIGFIINSVYNKDNAFKCETSVYWFISYMALLLGFSYIGTFGGKSYITFPWDILAMLPLSILILFTSQFVIEDGHKFEEPEEDAVLLQKSGVNC